jgi:hypothetical protein
MTNHTDLVARLRGGFYVAPNEAADRIESQAKEIERRDEETPLEVQAARDCEKWERARADKAEAEVARLREALTEIVRHGVSREQFIMQGPAFAAKMVTAVIAIARRALKK